MMPSGLFAKEASARLSVSQNEQLAGVHELRHLLEEVDLGQ